MAPVITLPAIIQGRLSDTAMMIQQMAAGKSNIVNDLQGPRVSMNTPDNRVAGMEVIPAHDTVYKYSRRINMEEKDRHGQRHRSSIF